MTGGRKDNMTGHPKGSGFDQAGEKRNGGAVGGRQRRLGRGATKGAQPQRSQCSIDSRRTGQKAFPRSWSRPGGSKIQDAGRNAKTRREQYPDQSCDGDRGR